MALTLLLIGLVLLTLCLADVNIRTNGPAWMCNINPENEQIISPLSASDQNLINKLEQVQAFHRHGARVGSDPISSMLPNSNLKYKCNITSVVTRQYMNDNYYSNSSNKLFNLRKIYIENEQYIEGNCHYRQSLKYLIPQQKANAHHLKQAYIGNESYHLFNNSVLNEIANNFIQYSEDNRIRLTTTDYERTIASLTVIASELFTETFNDNTSNNIIMNTIVHDTQSDPYHPDDNEICINKDEYKMWLKMYKNDELLNNTAADDIINSVFGNATISAFESEGGNWFKNKVGMGLLYPYCAGITLPLSNQTFFDAVKLSYLWLTAHLNTSYAHNQIKCFNNFLSIPIFYQIRKDINQMRNDSNMNSKTKMVIHSVHDSTLILILRALGMYDNNLIIFGELLTLEIYSSKYNDNLYYFRWTRKGEFIPYPFCNYNNTETQLCDLDIMFKYSFKDVVSQSEWSNGLCSTVVSDCRCGYCIEPINNTKTTTSKPECNNSSDSFNASNVNFSIGIIIGVVVGIVLAAFIIILQQKCCRKQKTHHQQFLL